MKPYKIAIVGAGAAGIFTAAALKRNIPNAEVELVFDPKLKHIGVGESLGFRARIFFHDVLGLHNESQWMKESESTYKIGIRFTGWDGTNITRYWGPGKSFYMGFTNPAKGHSLDDVWLSLYNKGLRTLEDFEYDFPEGRFTVNRDPLNLQMHSYHINAEHIRETIHKLVGLPAGVKERPVPVKEVVLKDNGYIDHLLLEDLTRVEADLFIDCTGFGKLLANKLPFKHKSYDEYYNNTAIVGPYKYQDESEKNRVFTDHVAMDYGWRFSVPLQERTGEGYITNSRIYSNDDQLIAEWEKQTGKKNIIGRKLTWDPGYLEKGCINNCVVIGLGYGMVDPYDANVFTTSLKFITKLMECIKEDPDKTFHWRDKFNKFLNDVSEDIKLRIDVGLHLAPKNDTIYWQAMKEAAKKHNTLERLLDTISSNERRFQTTEFHVGQHSQLEFLWYYGIDFKKIKVPTDKISSYTEEQALNIFRNYNRLHRAMDISDCWKLTRRSSMDRTRSS